MADKSSKDTKGGNGEAKLATGFKMPTGAIQVQSAERFYWFPYVRADGSAQAITIQDIEKGRANPCHCIVLYRQERHDSTPEKPGHFYAVKLLQPALAVDREKVVHEMKPGDVIVVDERIQLIGLQNFIKGPNLVECVIMPKGKIAGGQGSVALYDLHAIPTDKPRPQIPGGGTKALPPPEELKSEAGAGADEIPF